MITPRGSALSLAVLLVSASCLPSSPPSSLPPTEGPTNIVAAPPSLTPSRPTDTAAPGPFVLDLTPLPTPTALATLALPSPPSPLLGDQVWDGLPTYPADSRPDFYFRLRYDPLAWALTTDQRGYAVLVSRNVAGCVLGQAAGRGLPQSAQVDHEVRMLGGLTFEISRVTANGVTQFVNYAGGNGVIFTAFEATFQDRTEDCLQTAEAVLGTLRSVPVSEATAVAP